MTKNKLIILIITALNFYIIGCDKNPNLKTEEDKTIYVVGQNMAEKIKNLNLNEQEQNILMMGLRDSLSKKKSQVDVNAYTEKASQLNTNRNEQAIKNNLNLSVEFLKKMESTQGAVKTQTGMIFIEKKKGTGSSPEGSDLVKMHYECRLYNGTLVDSSRTRNEPIQFALNQVIPCWSEALKLMKVGGKAQVICPAEIAYKDNGVPPNIPGGATLDFEIELLEVHNAGSAAAQPLGLSNYKEPSATTNHPAPMTATDQKPPIVQQKPDVAGSKKSGVNSAAKNANVDKKKSHKKSLKR
jgi:FKBP-type peptidyl-prolyl cis-trans isomerase FkpA